VAAQNSKFRVHKNQ